MTCAFWTEDATFLSFSVFKDRINMHSLTHDRRGKKHANYVFFVSFLQELYFKTNFYH